jgi:hypothetical protein
MMNDTFGIHIALISHPFRAFNWELLLIIGLCPMISYHTLSGLLTIVHIIHFIQKSINPATQKIESTEKTVN